MSINSYQREIYANQLQHGERRNHKYLYKEGNRYIYPEDLKKGAQNAGRAVKNKATELYNDRHIYADAAKNMASDYAKAIKDKWDNGGKEHLKNFGKAILPSTLRAANKGLKGGSEVVKETKAKSDAKAKAARDERDAKFKENDKQLQVEIGKGKVKIAKKVFDDSIPEGYKKGPDGRIYDSIGAVATESELERARRKQKKPKTNTVAKHSALRSNTMNLYQREIYASQLKHGLEWKRHKYIRKEGNRYIYPEDLEGGHRMHGGKWDNSLNITGADRNHVDVHGNPDVVLSKRYNDRALQSGNAAKMKAKMAVANKDVSKMDEAWKDARKADELYSKSRTGDEKKISSLMSSNIDKKAQAISRANRLDKEAEKSKIVARRKKINPDDQRKSAHAGYEADKKAFPEGGSTEELERQKRKTKARKSAAEISKTGTTKNLEREKRKTALRKRHKK